MLDPDEEAGRSNREYLRKQYLLLFAGTTDKEFRRLVHLCQFLAFYEHPGNLAAAEHASHECFKPYLIMSRHVMATMVPADVRYETCMATARVNVPRQPILDMHFASLSCVDKFKRTIIPMKDKIEQLYKGYLLNLQHDPRLREAEQKLA